MWLDIDGTRSDNAYDNQAHATFTTRVIAIAHHTGDHHANNQAAFMGGNTDDNQCGDIVSALVDTLVLTPSRSTSEAAS